ncbi:MAG: hypothetical protein KDJ65_16080 [Anaerolineae bacterium]|nr:hypothetical protein [Anaerolineae bacterium]
MILVRMVFQVKWGKVHEVVNEFKQIEEMMRRVTGSNLRVRILTDLSGPFNTVVQEIEVESLAEWERQRATLFSDPEFQQRQAVSEQPFEAGSIEFYTIEAELGKQ